MASLSVPSWRSRSPTLSVTVYSLSAVLLLTQNKQKTDHNNCLCKFKYLNISVILFRVG